MFPDYDLERLSITAVCVVVVVMFTAIGIEIVGLHSEATDRAKAVIGVIVVTCTGLFLVADVLRQEGARVTTGSESAEVDE